MKVGFVLLSNSQSPIPSTRIAALNMFPFLRDAGFNPSIVFEPPSATETPRVPDLSRRLVSEGVRIVVFQKVHGPAVEDLAIRLRAVGIRTLYLVCDLVDSRMAALTDATVVVTDFLKSLYPPELWPRIHVVHDGIERPEFVRKAPRDDRGSPSRPLRAVLVTSAHLDRLPVLVTPPPWLEVEIVGRYSDQRRWREARWTFLRLGSWHERANYIRFISNRRIHRVSWQPIGVYERMRDADIGIIPIDTQLEASGGSKIPDWMVKSENRLTMKMCVGLPVVATPIPAYEEVIEHGRNGFLARSRNEWLACLDALRNPATRYSIGDRARQSVINRYSTREQARRLIIVINGLLDD